MISLPIESKGTIMNIFILTGAGISADSGLQTFRDSEDGLWEGHRIEDVCVAGCFEDNTQGTIDFYDDRRRACDAHEPNAAHYAIAEYIAKTKNNVMLITQNVDNYHELAGANPIKMHGDLYKLVCTNCGHNFKVGKGFILGENYECEDCKFCNTTRPDIVFFGEDIHIDFTQVNKFLKGKVDFESLSYFISIGTSGNVYPAAGFGNAAHFNSTKVYINLTSEDATHIYTDKRIGRARDTVPAFFNELFEKHG